ncbi:MAG: NAD-binding protein [Acidimicrobiales bacterium]
MTDVFICYSRRDLDFVRRLAEALRERAADMFVDLGEWWWDDASQEGISGAEQIAVVQSLGGQGGVPGQKSSTSVGDTGSPEAREVAAAPRTDEVHAAIRGATSVLAVVSPDMAASARCRHEIERAVALRKRLVAVGAHETPPESLHPQLRRCELFSFRAGDFDTVVGRLVRELEEDSPRISAWASVHRRRWTLLGIMALVFLGLGLWGYSDLYPRLAFIDRLYAALALFRDNTTIYSGAGPSVVVPPFPWPLEVARWFAPLTLVLAGLSAIFAVLAEPFNRLRIGVLYRRHLVVCGLGHFGLRLASAFQARGERVVAVDSGPSSVALSRCRELSIPVLVGDATDPEVLRRAGLGRATRIVAVCGDNSVNDRIGMAAKRVVTTEQRARARRRRLDCFLHVDDDQMCQRLEQSSLADIDKRGVSLSYVNVFRSGGLALLGEFPHSFAERDGCAPHIVVVGPDRVGLLLIVGAVKEWWFDHRGDALRLDLTLVAADASKRVRALRRRYPHFEEACDLTAVACDPADPDSPDLPVLVKEEDCGRATVFVSYADERAGLEAVMQVASHTPSRVPIVALTTGQTGPVTLLDRAAAQLHLSNVTTFPLLDRLCRPDVFVNSVTEQMARALHGNYLLHRRLDGTYDPSRESHKSWDLLSETFRDSNRDAAMHLSGRLDEAGYSVQVSDDWAVVLPELTGDEIRRLAESEHRRWCEERLANGWTYAAETDLEHKRHTDLVPWSKLAESRKELDFEAQRELPVLLARYGLAIVRKSPPVARTGPSAG